MFRKVVSHNRHFVIGLIWLTGFMIGIASVFCCDASFNPKTFGDIFLPASLPGILLSSTVPIISVCILCFLELRFIIYIVLFINGFLYGFCGYYLSYTTGCPFAFSCLLFMFSQCCCSTLLVALCSTFICGSCGSIRHIFSSVLLSSVLISLFDYFLI